jgi:hypothetical protein
MAKKETASAEYSEDTHDIVPIVDHVDSEGNKGTTAMSGASHYDIANHQAELAKSGTKSTIRYAAIRKPGLAGISRSVAIKTQPTAKQPAAKTAPKAAAAKPATAKPAAKKAAPKKAK